LLDNLQHIINFTGILNLDIGNLKIKISAEKGSDILLEQGAIFEIKKSNTKNYLQGNIQRKQN